MSFPAGHCQTCGRRAILHTMDGGRNAPATGGLCRKCLDEAERPWAVSFPELIMRKADAEVRLDRAEWRHNSGAVATTLELEGYYTGDAPTVRPGDRVEVAADGRLERFTVTRVGVHPERLSVGTIGEMHPRTVDMRRGTIELECDPLGAAALVPSAPAAKPLATQAEAERHLAETREACADFDLDDLT